MMQSSRFVAGVLLLASSLFGYFGHAQTHTLIVDGPGFRLDGKPYQIISGEMHYTRIPREDWRDRLHKARLMGLNTITTYAFWNVHEPRPGNFDFSGQNDIAEYLREAQAEGLHVILRPGPYVCAEWELGGYPSWLLKAPSVKLRSRDPAYTQAVDGWLRRLGQEVSPLLLRNGGPIIAIQLENEYGAFGDDSQYLEELKAAYVRAGLGNGVLFTSNQAGDLEKGSLPELPSAVNFGSGGAKNAIAKLEASRPDGLRMVGEYWAGWFDKWGEEHHQTDGKVEADELRMLLKRGYSVSMYMFEGGTNFGWMNGADSHNGSDYHPDTTSYDYDAPLDERGNPNYKYVLFRDVIAESTGLPRQALPRPTEARVFPLSGVKRSASLWRNLPTPVTSPSPLTFEDLQQSYGYVLYRTGLDEGSEGLLKLEALHDYALVYIDQQLIGSVDRRLGQDSIVLPKLNQASTLDILVENTGRINYSHAIRDERAGLAGAVTLAGKTLHSWEMFSLPMDDLTKLRLLPESCTGPCFYEQTIQVNRPSDTYLDTRLLHKGQLWLGTHNLGRFWSVGPQHTLYAPGAWLAGGSTTITFFDLQGEPAERVSSIDKPIFGAVTHHRENQ